MDQELKSIQEAYIGMVVETNDKFVSFAYSDPESDDDMHKLMSDHGFKKDVDYKLSVAMGDTHSHGIVIKNKDIFKANKIKKAISDQEGPDETYGGKSDRGVARLLK